MTHATSSIQDHEIASANGFFVLAAQLGVSLVLGVFLLALGGLAAMIGLPLLALANLLMLGGYYILDPNQSAVHVFFGEYVGTVSTNGLRWNNFLYSTTKATLRVNNFESRDLKVNDLSGNPIHISAVVVWRIRDAASAFFSVDNYEQFIAIQSEAALRSMAAAYPYDKHDENTLSLRDSQDEISARLSKEIQDRVQVAGLEIMEARLNKLSYAPEIAGAMLQRQQAEAVVAARQKIVEGAVGMVEMALEQLEKKEIVNLDPERRAQMVSNLLVVLCGDRGATPVVNAGSIHS